MAQLSDVAVSGTKSSDEHNGDTPNTPLFEVMGLFSTPIAGIEPGWFERHDELIETERGKAIFRRFYEDAWNTGNLALVDDIRLSWGLGVS